MAGFLNLIHPNRIEVLGRDEVAFLQELGQAEQSATVDRILRSKPLAIVMGDGLEPPPRVAQALEAGPTALIRSDLSANELANYIVKEIQDVYRLK